MLPPIPGPRKEPAAECGPFASACDGRARPGMVRRVDRPHRVLTRSPPCSPVGRSDRWSSRRPRRPGPWDSPLPWALREGPAEHHPRGLGRGRRRRVGRRLVEVRPPFADGRRVRHDRLVPGSPGGSSAPPHCPRTTTRPRSSSPTCPPGQQVVYRVTFQDLAYPKSRSFPAEGRFRTPPVEPADVTLRLERRHRRPGLRHRRSRGAG